MMGREKKVAEAGYNKIIQAHTIMHRARQLQKIIKRNSPLKIAWINSLLLLLS